AASAAARSRFITPSTMSSVIGTRRRRCVSSAGIASGPRESNADQDRRLRGSAADDTEAHVHVPHEEAAEVLIVADRRDGAEEVPLLRVVVGGTRDGLIGAEELAASPQREVAARARPRA